MRHWLTLGAVFAFAGIAIFSGTEPFTEHVRAYRGEALLYAAQGGRCG